MQMIACIIIFYNSFIIIRIILNFINTFGALKK